VHRDECLAKYPKFVQTAVKLKQTVLQCEDFVACLVCKKGTLKSSQRAIPQSKWLEEHTCFTEANWDEHKQYYKIELAEGIEMPVDIDTIALLNEKDELAKQIKILTEEFNKASVTINRLTNELSEVKEALVQAKKEPVLPATLENVLHMERKKIREEFAQVSKDQQAEIARLKAAAPPPQDDTRIKELERQLLEAKKAPKSTSSMTLKNHKDVSNLVMENLKTICIDPRLNNMTVSERTVINNKAQDNILLLEDMDNGIPIEDNDDDQEEQDDDDQEEQDDNKEKDAPAPKPAPKVYHVQQPDVLPGFNLINNTKIIRKATVVKRN
jgi:hypothetical protein